MKFTPEQVVARYRELNCKAIVGTTALEQIAGTWRLHSGQCCALGVMMEGRPAVARYDLPADVGHHLEVDYGSFYTGFDGLLPGTQREYSTWSEDDYELGKACRQAVTDAGLWESNDVR